MASEFRYRSQVITAAQIEFIRELITQHPGATRRRLSLLLCEAWEWKQPNGAPRDMVCRGLLLGLQPGGTHRVATGATEELQPSGPARGRTMEGHGRT
jgi:hypothetical protein